MRAPSTTLLIVAFGVGCARYEALSDVPCQGGFAAEFACDDIDLAAHLPNDALQSTKANDVWGWTDPETGAEIVLAGTWEGMAVVDATVPTDPVSLGFLPSHSGRNEWHDIKVVGNHAYIASEERQHGIQILDLTRLVAEPDDDLVADAWYGGVSTTHNLVSLPERNLLWAVGTDVCGGGMHAMDVTEPLQPAFEGCWRKEGYVHDAHCVVYTGPDTEHQGKSLCIANTPEGDQHVNILDVTSPGAPVILGATRYRAHSFSHQGWLTEDHRYYIMNDEEDEFVGWRTRTIFIDVTDLENPQFVGVHRGDTTAVDHNAYIVGDWLYQSNYSAGLQILRIVDPATAQLTQEASFDTYPRNDDANFQGAWSSYPFFDSGTVAVTSNKEGLFLLTPRLQ